MIQVSGAWRSVLGLLCVDVWMGGVKDVVSVQLPIGAASVSEVLGQAPRGPRAACWAG